MPASASSPRLGIYGSAHSGGQVPRGCGLWAAGYEPVITTAGGTPVPIKTIAGECWEELLLGLDGVVFAESRALSAQTQAQEERLVDWCRERCLPFLGVDSGMHVLNATYGGTLHLDLSREVPQALQHLHPPEPGDRHAITVVDNTHLARFYGEGEIVVNSEHRRALCKVARGFRVSARALDGITEAIEAENEDWFAMGVQWHPASASASGLDIQLFRGFIEACAARWQTAASPLLVAA